MRLTPPAPATFAIGVALLVIGFLLRIDVLNLPEIDAYSYWITLTGGIVLAAGAAFRGI
jgi:hypothetical protein